MNKNNKNYEDKIKTNGVVYTPENLANYVAQKALYYHQNSNQKTKANFINILDPACGDGELLLSITKKIQKEQKVCLFGVDIDANALTKAKERLNNIQQLNVAAENGLCPHSFNNSKGWKALNKEFGLKVKYDLIIANPPWGANISKYKDLVEDSDFSLYKKQFDTSDLFIESSLRLVKNKGIIAFIVPDSIFYQEKELLRHHLLSESKILFIGRFGEKLFKNVNRACAVIICEKSTPSLEHNVDCFRLSVNDRNSIISGDNTFELAEVNSLHQIRQQRFFNTPKYLFNIDISNDLEHTFLKIQNNSATLSEYLSSTRGVELSKKGKIIVCNYCNYSSPFPRHEYSTCSNCKKTFKSTECKSTTIITNKHIADSKPLIVGEHITRYNIDSDLYIETNHNGINYKSATNYQDPKIVIRKTGIGISASIDYQNCMTNQVVYIFKILDLSIVKFPLEFILAILNSRLAFFYIAMSSGEIEWRSHPYITQKQILTFPIPSYSSLSDQTHAEIVLISNEIKYFLQEGSILPRELDIRIEKKVAEIYNLTKNDYVSIYKALNKSQDLIPVQKMKSISLSDIFN